MMKYFLTSCVIVLLLISSITPNVLASSEEDDDAVTFIGFHNVATMPYNLSDNTATTFNEEFSGSTGGPRIYLVGGCTADQICEYENQTVNDAIFCFCPTITNKCMYFEPETETWSTNCQDAPTPRYRHMAAKVGEYLFVAGGRTVEDNLITTVERYDPATDTWTNPFNWSAASSDGAAFANGNTLYLVGGYDATYNTLTTLTAFDTTTGAIDTSLSGMQLGRGDIAAIPFDGDYYVVGGWSATTSNNWCDPSNDVEKYNIATDTWTTMQSLNHSRGDLVLGVMDDGIFAVGGEKKQEGDATCTYSVPVDHVERFLGSTELWNDEEDIPANLFRFSGAYYNSTYSDGETGEHTSGIYLFGGQGTYDATTMTYPLKGSTIKYVPASTVSSSGGGSSGLSEGGLAGVVIAAVVLVGLIIAAVVAALIYYQAGYAKLDDDEGTADVEMANAATTTGTAGAVVTTGAGNDDEDVEITFNK
mmetsp:Transcript_21940/g.36739  ORF Transcript_21940/g.36739 Transcript_21940/m.36739 type:complete len:476 (+) Transcript_21940:118-1545(+)